MGKIVPFSIAMIVFGLIFYSNKSLGLADDQSSTATSLEPDLKKEGINMNRAELGRHGWAILHTMSVKYPASPSQEQIEKMTIFLQYFAEHYPCELCARHFEAYIKKHPVDASSGVALMGWMCDAHNAVNKFLEKPLFDCSTYNDVWGGDCGCSVDDNEDFKMF